MILKIATIILKLHDFLKIFAVEKIHTLTQNTDIIDFTVYRDGGLRLQFSSKSETEPNYEGSRIVLCLNQVGSR